MTGRKSATFVHRADVNYLLSPVAGLRGQQLTRGQGRPELMQLANRRAGLVLQFANPSGTSFRQKSSWTPNAWFCVEIIPQIFRHASCGKKFVLLRAAP